MGFLDKAIKQLARQGGRIGRRRPRDIPPPPPVDAPADRPGTGTGTDTTSETGSGTETKTGARNDGCCNPFEFKHNWPKNQRGAVNEEANPMAYQYQVIVCGPTEYLCASTTGTTVWADGLIPDRCWMKEAKWSKSNIDSLFRSTKPDFLQRQVVDEYARYGVVAHNPAPPAKPCWNIKLRTITNYVENRPFFLLLMNRNDLMGDVIIRNLDWLDDSGRSMLEDNQKSGASPQPWVRDTDKR
jgi:hypothetical protein